MIERDLAPLVLKAAERFPAVTLTGPRQSGKSTLCRGLFPGHAYANLEAPDVRAFALEDPRGFLAQFSGGAILDEIQRAPELASYLQPLIDEDPVPGRWILTGSQNLSLLESVSQSLAGRTAVLHLLPLSYREIRRFEKVPQTLDEILLTGGYPRIYDQHIPAGDWLQSYVATYLERDVRSIARVGDLTTFQRFVDLCAGRTAQLINYSSLATDTGISQPTAKEWLSILETSFIMHALPPWSGNIRKRLVKMPKLHFHDSGLACWLLGIRTVDQLRTHPLRGALFESWVVSEILKYRLSAGERNGVYFFRDQRGLETDLLIEHATMRTLVEAKAGQTVTGDALTTIRKVAELLTDAGGTSKAVFIHGGGRRQERSDVTVLPWSEVGEVSWVGEGV